LFQKPSAEGFRYRAPVEGYTACFWGEHSFCQPWWRLDVIYVFWKSYVVKCCYFIQL